MKRLLRHVDEVIVPRLARGFARMTGRGRWRGHIFVGAGLVITAATLITVAVASHQRMPARQGQTAATTVHIGVAKGQSIPGYVNSSRQELRSLVAQAPAAPAEIYALVSLRTYLAPDRLTPVLGGVTVAEVYTRVPLAEVQTEIVRIPAFRMPGDVADGMARVAARKESQAEELRRLAAKLSATDTAEDQLRATYLDDANVAALEAEAYRAECDCVYAAVVRATPAALEQIAARSEVRAVDPAPEVKRIDQAVFLAPLPEQVASPQPVPEPSPTPSPEPSPTPSPTPTVVTPTASPTPTAEPLR